MVFQIDYPKLKKVLKGAGLAFGPAIFMAIVQAASSGALGPWALAAAPALSVLANLVIKGFEKPTPDPDKPPEITPEMAPSLTPWNDTRPLQP